MTHIIYSTEDEFRDNVFKFIVQESKTFKLKSLSVLEKLVNSLSCDNITKYEVVFEKEVFEFTAILLEGESGVLRTI